MEIEAVTQEQVNALVRAIGGMSAMICNLSQVDLSRGRGVLEDDVRCLWTKDGKRITIAPVPGPGIIASCSKEPDPDAPTGPTDTAGGS